MYNNPVAKPLFVVAADHTWHARQPWEPAPKPEPVQKVLNTRIAGTTSTLEAEELVEQLVKEPVDEPIEAAVVPRRRKQLFALGVSLQSTEESHEVE